MPDAAGGAENGALTLETVLAFCECCTESGLRADVGYALVPAHHDPACPVRQATCTPPPGSSDPSEGP